jgi:hypothetical protein
VPDGISKAGTTSLLLAAVLATACASQQDTIQQQKEKLESLGATTQTIGEGWLAGKLSRTFARTALEQTFFQVEQQRAVLAAHPQTLVDARGARLSQQAEQLSRLVAQMAHDVEATDGDAVRRRLAAIPIVPEAP